MNEKTKRLTESAILISIASVLSILRLVDLPYGGSVTFACMLPILLISYRHGILWGLGSGVIFGGIQQLLSLHTLSYATSAQAAVTIILLDYIVAFAVIGLGGMFRKKLGNQTAELTLGAFVVCLLRYACHVISGATVWVGLSIPTEAALLYSFGYNATYMVPETIVLLLATFYISASLDFRATTPSRIIRVKKDVAATVYTIIAGLFLTGGLVYDVVEVFSHMQDPENGTFTVTLLSNTNWIAVTSVSAVAVVCAAVMMILRKVHKVKTDKVENTIDI